jgi:phosphohistidine phosphatase
VPLWWTLFPFETEIMTQLYLLRHGIAVQRGASDVPDDERPLTPKGEKRMRQIGRGLRRLGLDFDKIATSPLPRARQTAEIVADALGLSDLLEDADALRADRSPAAIRDWVVGRPESSLMLVGHNPSLSELVGLLVVGGHAPDLCVLKKGGLAALSARPEGGFQIDWIATPRFIRRLADR